MKTMKLNPTPTAEENTVRALDNLRALAIELGKYDARAYEWAELGALLVKNYTALDLPEGEEKRQQLLLIGKNINTVKEALGINIEDSE